MPARVEIDADSGFCGGVIRAIGSAERFLDGNRQQRLYSLGAIVHNEEELARLAARGLVTIGLDDLENVAAADGGNLLIRAHGEPPSTYRRASELGFNVIDCTCPVVLRLQQRIREAHARLHEGGRSGQILIFGKIGHAEVLGLVGQVEGDAVVFETMEQLRSLLDAGTVDVNGPLEIFSQTTKSPSEYAEVCGALLAEMGDPDDLTVHDTICSQVASRHSKLADFARSHDVVIFVSGRSSSNGKVLYELCKSLNIRTYHVGSVAEIKKEWFRSEDSVGVCGATSTPKWLLEQVAGAISNL